jgi:hypothetical protein
MTLLNGPQIGIGAFVLLFSSALGGMWVAATNPRAGPLRAAADVVGRGTTVVAVLAALMLAFMISSLKTSFDAADQDVHRFASQLVDLDRTLRRAGPVGEPIRETLFRYTARVMKDIWPQSHPQLRPEDTASGRLLLSLEDQIDKLPVADDNIRADARRGLHDAQSVRIDIDARYGTPVSPWLFGFLLFWLGLTFSGLGLAAPRTPLSVTALFMFAVALGGALFLASEYAYPFDGVIIVSTEPVENALFAMTE